MNHPDNLAAAGCAAQNPGRHSEASADGVFTAGYAAGTEYRDRDAAPRIQTSVSVRADQPFSAVLFQLKRGQRITRAGWNGRGMYLEIQRPDKASKMTRPYIFMKTVDGALVPWVASQTDLLADDWAVLPETA